MIAETIIFAIVLAALLIGTYTDFKTREVPDWLNYSLIFIGLGLRSIFSLVYWDWHYIVEGLLGLGAFFLIALAMFYAGQWGGGDSKMVMGLGSLIGIRFSLDTFLLGFIINIVIFGALFGIVFSVFLALRQWKSFSKAFSKEFSKRKRTKWLVWIGTLALLVITLFTPGPVRASVVVLAGVTFVSFYMYVYLKAVEKSALIVWLPPERLTEGDWIVKDVRVGKKYICGPKDLGISEEQIMTLKKLKKQGRISKVLIKNGFPFVPSFLLAFIATYLWGNFVFSFLGI